MHACVVHRTRRPCYIGKQPSLADDEDHAAWAITSSVRAGGRAASAQPLAPLAPVPVAGMEEFDISALLEGSVRVGVDGRMRSTMSTRRQLMGGSMMHPTMNHWPPWRWSCQGRAETMIMGSSELAQY